MKNMFCCEGNHMRRVIVWKLNDGMDVSWCMAMVHGRGICQLQSTETD